ncbi:TetR family transcriptional regulator [Nocardia sp. CA2R105]|uniref:acyl-CoA-like ligand-binding transcription factor n=1 Tax=Nocardia coffeae TaxID=2873381 RepID=UPI001CA697AD|nr:TetR family transcriptional regulator [Nocardia coffeae]MBY8860913.1 TetR family transcriptional regulator [Nocardia coffeae]
MIGTPRSRLVARAAVRAALAQAAFEITRDRGFQNVTVDDMATAAGVSRSTLLRYFGSKEEAVLSAFDSHAAHFAETLRARPAEEDDWTALRRALDGVADFYLQDPAGALAFTQLILKTPELFGRHLETQHSWRPALTAALAERAGLTPDEVPLEMAVKAAAAVGCLTIAVERWADSDGTLDLTSLLDAGFDALAAGHDSSGPRRAGSGRTSASHHRRRSADHA